MLPRRLHQLRLMFLFASTPCLLALMCPTESGGFSSQDPTKTFTVVREHRYRFTTDVIEERSTETDTAEPPGGTINPQLLLLDILPCDGVSDRPVNIVVTAIHTSITRVNPPAALVLSYRVKMSELRVSAPTDPPIRRFEASIAGRSEQIVFRDVTGIRLEGGSSLRLDTAVISTGTVDPDSQMIVPTTVEVNTTITGFCASEEPSPSAPNP